MTNRHGSPVRVLPSLRPNELPVAWDGVPLTWGDLMPLYAMTHVEPYACNGHNGTSTAVDVYIGKVPGEPVEPYWIRDKTTGHARKRPGWETRHARLVLYRCLDCGHDQVFDTDSDTYWDLDETDYADEGSFEIKDTLW